MTNKFKGILQVKQQNESSKIQLQDGGKEWQQKRITYFLAPMVRTMKSETKMLNVV